MTKSETRSFISRTWQGWHDWARVRPAKAATRLQPGSYICICGVRAASLVGLSTGRLWSFMMRLRI